MPSSKALNRTSPKFIARFKDDMGRHWKREYFAGHIYQANRKAQGIAKSHGWKVTSVGKI